MRKIPALILIIAAVIPLLLATLFFFSVASWVLQPSFYRELLGDERLYSALLAEARARKGERWHVDVELPELRGVPAEALSKALAETLSAGYLRDQALALVEQFFAAAKGPAGELELSVDLAPVKALLRGQGRERFARALAEALPACASGQDSRGAPAGLLRCRPPGMEADAAARLIASALPGALDRLPDRYPLTSHPLQLFPEPEARFWAGFLVTARLVWAGLILAAVAAAFWIGAAFLGGRDSREVLAFLGWSLFVPALLVLLTGLAIRFVLPGRSLLHLPLFWTWTLAPQASGELAAALAETLGTALHTVARGFLVSGAVSIGLALGLIAWTRSLEPEPPG